MPKLTTYKIEVIRKGKWRPWETAKGGKAAQSAFDSAKLSWNNIRVKRGDKVIKTYTYKKTKF